MNYYPFHIGDYRSHTGHLGLMHDLAYRRLLDLYYTHERPLPADPERCARLVLMPEHVQEVREVLAEFFELTDEGHQNRRCDTVLDEYSERREKARRAGLASGAARRALIEQQQQMNAGSAPVERMLNSRSTTSEHPINARSTPDEHHLSAGSTNVERPWTNQNQNQTQNQTQRIPPLTPPSGGIPPENSQTDGGLSDLVAQTSTGSGQITVPLSASIPEQPGVPSRQKKSSTGLQSRPVKCASKAPEDWVGVHIDRPADVSPGVWRDFCTLRKRKNAPVTETALRGVRDEAGRVGASLEQALTFTVAKGHQGFHSDAWQRERGLAQQPRAARQHRMNEFTKPGYTWEDGKMADMEI